MTHQGEATGADKVIEVAVIGGGYAGVIAANRLRQRGDVSVSLINPRSTFVERIRLHQKVAGTHEAVHDFSEVLGEGVRLVVDTATGIDPTERTVALASGETIHYDYLIYAVGSHATIPDVPGADFTYPVATLEEAKQLTDILAAAPADAPITVVGGGPTGMEVATELAEAGRHVTLACGGELGPYLHPRVRRSVAKHMRRLGVHVLDGAGATVTAVSEDTVQLHDGREIPSEVTIWTAGFDVPDLAKVSGLTTDAAGRLATDETLTSIDDYRVVATGDAAAPSGMPFRMSCQAAVQLGPHAADTVLARIAGEEPTENQVGLGALCLSLGRDVGIYQFANRNDSATRFFLGGSVGAKVKEYICAHIVGYLTKEAQDPGSLTWPTMIRDKKRQGSIRWAEAGNEVKA